MHLTFKKIVRHKYFENCYNLDRGMSMSKYFGEFRNKYKRFFEESTDAGMKPLSLSSVADRKILNPEHGLMVDQPPNIFEYIENFDAESFLKMVIPPKLEKFARSIPWNRWVDTPEGGRVMLPYGTGQMLYKIYGELYPYDIMSGELVEYNDGSWIMQTDIGSYELLLTQEGTGNRWMFRDGQWWFDNGGEWEIWDV